MEILKIILITILVFIIGFFWFSKFFVGEKKMDLKKDRKLIITEFVLAFITNFFLYFIAVSANSIWTVIITTLVLWFGFVLTTNVSDMMWENTSKKYMAKKIVISSGYRLVSMFVAALIFFIW